MKIIFLVLILVKALFLNTCNADGEGCNKGWHRFHDKCYFVKHELVFNSDMEKICSKLNGTMVSIHSDEENAFIKSITWKRQYYWLGAHRVEKGSRDFIWKDGSSWNYQKWWGAEPDQTNEPNSFCTSLFTGDIVEWFDDKCDIKRYQLCQKYAVSPAQINKIQIQNLKNNLSELMNSVGKSFLAEFDKKIKELEMKMANAVKILGERIDDVYIDIELIAKAFEKVLLNIEEDEDRPHGGRIVGGLKSDKITEFDDISYSSCYTMNKYDVKVIKCYYFEKYKYTFDEANDRCKSFKSGLVTINDESENNFLKYKLLFNQDYWTAGLRILPTTYSFAWSNGDYFTYSNWGTNHPNKNLTSNCVSIRNGQWYSSDCNEKFSFICEKIRAPKKYFANELGTALIHRHSIELDAAKQNLSIISSNLKNMKDKETKLIEVLGDVIEGKLFVGSSKSEASNSDSKNKRGKRSAF